MQDMVEIGNMFRELGLSEMTVKDGDFEISLKKAESTEDTKDRSASSENRTEVHLTGNPEESPAPKTQAAGSSASDGTDKKKGTPVTAPLPGIFYESESDKAEPFVKVGDSVEPDTVVCAIEAMKMLNNVKAGVSGKIKEVCVSPGQMVEFGQTLFLIEKE